MNTNWSTPHTNLFSAILCLRKALNSGYNAKLAKEYNENCAYPLIEKENKLSQDFRKYTGNGSIITKRSDIVNGSYTEFEKHLMLNYHSCFGTQESVDQYYNTGKLSKDNFLGVGRCHLIKITDMIEFLEANNQNGSETERIDMFKKQFITLETAEERNWYDCFKSIYGSSKQPIKFKNKVWIVVILDKNEPQVKMPLIIRVLNAVLKPFKYIPKRSVLHMPSYKIVTYRVGDVINGFSIDIHIPKKFSFK